MKTTEEHIDKLIEEKKWDEISELVNYEYVTNQIHLVQQMQPELKELTFLKTTLETENGGIYLISFLHVSGPKIKLEVEHE